jgi:hypothetical protein
MGDRRMVLGPLAVEMEVRGMDSPGAAVAPERRQENLGMLMPNSMDVAVEDAVEDVVEDAVEDVVVVVVVVELP